MAYFYISNSTLSQIDKGYYTNLTDNLFDVLIIVDSFGVITETLELNDNDVLYLNQHCKENYAPLYDNPKELSYKEKLLDKVDFINKMSL